MITGILMIGIGLILLFKTDYEGLPIVILLFGFMAMGIAEENMLAELQNTQCQEQVKK